MLTQERGKGKEGGAQEVLFVHQHIHGLQWQAHVKKDMYNQPEFNGMYLCLGMHACMLNRKPMTCLDYLA